jgi:hypothetical protein
MAMAIAVRECRQTREGASRGGFEDERNDDDDDDE